MERYRQDQVGDKDMTKRWDDDGMPIIVPPMTHMFVSEPRPKKQSTFGEHRELGMYISGNPGMGKSSLIQILVLDNFKKGHGVCVIDPTRDLVNTLLDWVPQDRVSETIYFDSDAPPRLDMFSYRTKADRRILTDQLLDLFSLEAAPISRPRLLKILGTLFDANDAGGHYTFLDILNFIEDKELREEIFRLVPDRRQTWEPFPKVSEFSSITERITPFKEFDNLKEIFSGGGLNMWEILEKNQILLVSLRDTPADLFLGSLIVAKIQQAIFARDAIPEQERVPYYLYVDECHTVMKFCAPQFETILTRARKYKLCLTMANQLAGDLPKEIQRKLPTIFSQIQYEGPFQALCRFGKTEGHREMPTYLPKSPVSYAKEIKQNKIKYPSAAQYRQKRTGGNEPLHSQPVSHNEENVQDKGGTIPPSGAASIPVDKPKKKRR